MNPPTAELSRPSDIFTVYQPPRRRKPQTLELLTIYWAVYLVLHIAGSTLTSHQGALLGYLPAALSLALFFTLGPKALPAAILAPLPVDLWLRPLGLPPWTVLGLAAALATGQALAVMAFKAWSFSSRLRRIQDAAAFLALTLLGPLLAALPVAFLLRVSDAVPQDRLGEEVLSLLLSHALGALVLGPALLLWIRPRLLLRPLPGQTCVSALQMPEFLFQCGAMVVTAVLVARFSEPTTLHLKYLLLLPLFWMVLRGGLLQATLGFPILGLALSLALLQGTTFPEAIRSIQAFLILLFGMALFLGAFVNAHREALSWRDRGARRLNQLVESTGAIPWEMDLETGRCGHLGLAVEPMLGWSLEAWKRKPFWGKVVHPDDRLAFLRFLRDVSRPGRDHQLEFRLRDPQNEEHWVRAAGGPVPGRAEGRVMGFLFDIHAHKRAEENALRASLKEKDLLLREIHHRVKNNLQVVSSLLRLQASNQEDPALQRALKEAQERIQAIALIHQNLKHAPDFSKVDLQGYVRTLAERLVRSYASVPALIDLQVRVSAVEIGPDAPVPLGLILNELVANALQHAFPPGEGGSLDIEIATDARGWVVLRVSDSGQGLPESVDLGTGGLGFQLVKALTDQLGGALELERRRGASFLLSFPPFPPHP